MRLLQSLSLVLLITSAPIMLKASSTKQVLPIPDGRASRIIPPSNPDNFYFVVSGDNRSVMRDVPMPPTAPEIFKEIALIHPSITLWTGDSIYGFGDTPGEATREYNLFLNAAAKSNTPIYNAPGNHEVPDNPVMQAIYEKKMGRIYGSFDCGKSHFIVVDTEEPHVKGGISPAQMTWLKSDLEANKGAAHIFAFMHHPIYPVVESEGIHSMKTRHALEDLFEQYHVEYVFSGHEHLYHESIHNGTHYIISGGGGAPLDAAPQDGGFEHYILVHVDGSKITATVLQPWRLFCKVGPIEADGSDTAFVENYNRDYVPVQVEFPSGLLKPGTTTVTAYASYKKQKTAIDARIVPCDDPGMLAVSLIAPPAVGTVIRITPQTVK